MQNLVHGSWVMAQNVKMKIFDIFPVPEKNKQTENQAKKSPW